METVTSKFASLFDPTSVSHVEWLMKFFDLSKVALDIDKKVDVVGFIHTNPMGITLSSKEVLDWVEIHFIVSMKYMKLFMDGKAYIPHKCIPK
jgi:hypothetical protein